MLCDFLGVKEYKTGTNILNRSMNILSYYLPTFLSTPWDLATNKGHFSKAYWTRFMAGKDLPMFKFNYGPFEILKRRFLMSQIEKHLKNVKKVDRKLLVDGTLEYKTSVLNEFGRSRGITTSQTSDILKNEWLTFSSDPKADINQTVWYSLLLHHHLLLATSTH